MASRKKKERDDGIDMVARLAPYGIAAEQALAQPLIVPPGKTLHIAAKEGPGLVALRPRGIDDVKRWIGVPDEIARNRKARLTAITAKSLAAKALSTDSRELHDVAMEYVLADSGQFTAHRDLLDRMVSNATIFGIFLLHDLDVYGEMEIDPSVRVLFARRVRIFGRGSIRFRGAGKIDAVSIEGARRFRFTLGDLIPLIGTFIAREVRNA
jgi:hypothetical protein